MEKNKSIDGLSSRREKNATTKKTATKTTAKTTAKIPAKTATKTTAKSSATLKTTNIPVESAKKAVKSTPHQIKVTTPKPTAEPSEPILKPVIEATSESAAHEDFLKPTNVFNFDEESGELKAAPTSKAKDDLDEEDDFAMGPLNNKKSKKPKKKISKKRKIITIVILSIVSILIIGVIWFILWGNDIIAKITGGQGNVMDLLFQSETYEPLKTDGNGRTNILAIGTSGYNMEGDEGNGVHDGAQLTDSIMVISLNQETGDLAMLSLPRDLKVSRTCTATGKINEIYWCNNMDGDDEAAGNQAIMDEVGEILGIEFQYYVHVNWGSLVDIVNTLGGITVTLDEDIEDYAYTKAVFEAGVPYTINGEEALGLARARHGTASGDFSRGASQQKILIGIKDKLLEKSLSIPELLSLASTLGDNLRTNFSIDELKTFAHLLSDLDLSSMRQISLIEPERLMTTDNINGISYVIPSAGVGNYTKIQTYIEKMFSNDPRDYEDATILVLNGTDTPGLASTEQSNLEEDGYNNIDIDDAPEGEYTDKYTLYSLSDTAPGTKKLLEEKYNISAKTLEELPESIDTTYNFVIIIGNDNKSDN